jgi:hypothetical protein
LSQEGSSVPRKNVSMPNVFYGAPVAERTGWPGEEGAVSAEKRYVLCTQYPDGGVFYISGPEPETSLATRDILEAMVFTSPAEAIAFRDRLPHQESHYATQYRVNEWVLDGGVVPV